jgi:tetratricopeptide (TPR) repeat protein
MTQTSTEPAGTLEQALAHAGRLLETAPALAAEQADEILKVVPNHPPAVLILAQARGRLDGPAAELEIIEPLAQAQQKWAAAQFELALTLERLGRGDEAVAALRRTVALKPKHPEAWRHLGDHLLAQGEAEEADIAFSRHVQASAGQPAMQQAAAAMLKNELAAAQALLEAQLARAPNDITAMRMLAEVAMRGARYEEAGKLLRRCLEIAPGYSAARYNYAVLLHRRNDPAEAIVEIERLLAAEPRNPSYRNLLAVLLGRVGEYERSAQTYKDLLAEYPKNPKVWLSYGHVLKTAGPQAECIAAYRRAIELDPGFGEAFWSLANLKTFRFTPEDLAQMHAQVRRAGLADEHRVHLHFALGKAHEDAGDYAVSFEHYDRANALHRALHPYDADNNTKRMRRLKEGFTREFFAARAGGGCDARDPIFIVGMPRAGSTLVEQILSSHSSVEGTAELPEIIALAKDLRLEAKTQEIAAYVEVLADRSPAELRELGERYLERTRIHRKQGRPFFIDKMPNNFLHIGLIQLILPHAKIIDARRHPLGCCFSNFKQHYARGQNFSYSLDDMGRFYCDYVELMAHFDAVLPGRVHRVIYERMVEDTEGEVRRLLDYCGLPFEEGCLRFFENDRPVRTASAEQVRQPIYREGVDQWRNFEAWLDPLKAALGPELAD